MRRTEREMKKLRLKIIELRKEGKTWEETRRITNASPNTLSKILKNFTGRYCQKCGETNPKVLEEHHPDKINRPDFTITLCANCHEEITRKQLRERVKKQKLENPESKLIPQETNISPVSETPKQVLQNIQQHPANFPFSPKMESGIAATGIGIYFLFEGFNHELSKKERILMGILGALGLGVGAKIIWDEIKKMR